MSHFVVELPPLFDAFTEDKDDLGGDDTFPDAVIMLSLGGGKYAAVNVTTGPPSDRMTVGCLACFANDKEVDVWEEKFWSESPGERVNKNFQEAREIALSKDSIHGLALQVGAQTQHIHWVR